MYKILNRNTHGTETMTFTQWIDTFVAEKGLAGRMIEVEGPKGLNIMPVGVLVEAIKGARGLEKKAIKGKLVHIDFINGDVMAFFTHLARSIAI